MPHDCVKGINVPMYELTQSIVPARAYHFRNVSASEICRQTQLRWKRSSSRCRWVCLRTTQKQHALVKNEAKPTECGGRGWVLFWAYIVETLIAWLAYLCWIDKNSQANCISSFSQRAVIMRGTTCAFVRSNTFECWSQKLECLEKVCADIRVQYALTSQSVFTLAGSVPEQSWLQNTDHVLSKHDWCYESR